MALEFGLHGAPSTPTVLLHNKSAILLANGMPLVFLMFVIFYHLSRSLPPPFLCLPLSLSLSLSLPSLSPLVITPSSSSADVVKFPPPDLILGTGHLSSQLLLFTLHQGVVAVSQTSVVSTTATPTLTKSSRMVTTSSRYIYLYSVYVLSFMREKQEVIVLECLLSLQYSLCADWGRESCRPRISRCT